MFYDVMLVEFLSAVRIGNVDALRNFARPARCLQVRDGYEAESVEQEKQPSNDSTDRVVSRLDTLFIAKHDDSV